MVHIPVRGVHVSLVLSGEDMLTTRILSQHAQFSVLLVLQEILQIWSALGKIDSQIFVWMAKKLIS